MKGFSVSRRAAAADIWVWRMHTGITITLRRAGEMPGPMPGQISGPISCSDAEAVWQRLDGGCRRFLCWHVPAVEREREFARCLCSASVVAQAWHGGELAAVAWVARLMPGSECGFIHFCVLKRARARAACISRAVLWLLRARGFRCLLGLIPARFGHAVRFAGSMGFALAALLPGACWLAEAGRAADGALMRREL